MKRCDEYRRIILAAMHAALKPRAFRKQGATFVADRGATVLLVNLQSSSSTTEAALKVTVNLGVYSRTLAAREGNTRDPSLLEAHWRERIGCLMPQRHDKWWLVESEQEAEQAGREIRELLESGGLPLLESLASTEALQALWAAGKSTGLTEHQRLRYLVLLRQR